MKITASMYPAAASPARQTVKPKQSRSEVKTPNTVDSFVRSDPKAQSEQTQAIAYQPPKKLSAEQVGALKRQMQQSMLELAKTMLGAQQGLVKTAAGNVDFAALAVDLGIGATPEAAAQAVAQDGAWGVDAVATRLMDMATSLSKGDPAMAETLREAVQKGFAAVGRLEDLPQVSQDTYHETMNRFDYWIAHGSLEGYAAAEQE